MTPPERIETTGSEAETYRLGEALGATLEAGAVVLLRGPLGVGKTVLARGISAGLGVAPREVRSPSFTLVNQYPGRVPVFHVDLYRCEAATDLDELGLDEILAGAGVCLIEWPERLGGERPAGAVEIVMEDLGGDRRRLTMRGSGLHSCISKDG